MNFKQRFLLATGLLLWSVSAYGADSGTALARWMGQSSLYFIENHGQVAGPARYYLRGRDRTVFVSNDALTFVLEPNATTHNAYALRLEFVGARPDASLRGEGPKGPAVNLLTGGRESWRTGLPSYSRLVYTDLWPGIDLALIGDTQRVKYEFRVKPGADPSRIRLRYRGGESLRLESSGDLAVDTPLGTLRDEQPFSFQELGGRRAEVSTQYALAAAGDEIFGFALADYDRTKPLIIDPVVFVSASYLGGAGEDRGNDVAVDRFGAIYVTGDTTSLETSFPTGAGFGALPGADTSHNGGYDIFVAKVLPSGTGLEYVTYIGGSGNDLASRIAVDRSGCVYVTGYTNSGAQFPVVTGPTMSYHGGAYDVFVFKLNSSGTALVYSGFIGGNNDDREPAMALDDAGSVYISGITYSTEATFPTGAGFGSLPGPDHTHNGGGDGFVAKVQPDGSGLVYASYIGGSGEEIGYEIGVDAAGNAYIGGNTTSNENTFPDGDGIGTLPGPNPHYAGGSADAFVVKVDATGDSFSYVTFVGGAGEDRYAPGLTVSPQGSAFIAGRTASREDTFPTGSGFGSIPGFDRTYNGGDWDAFAVKINTAGTAFDFATYIGGSGWDDGGAIAVDSGGNTYLTGRTDSTQATFPNGEGFGSFTGPDTTYNGGPHDAFVAMLNAAGTELVYATYIGGPGGGFYDELGSGITVDASRNAYLTGYTTSSSGFPGGNGFGSLPGFDQSFNGGTDGYLVKISAGDPLTSILVDAGDDAAVPVDTQVDLSGSIHTGDCAPSFSWRFVGQPAASAAVLTDTDTLSPGFTPDVEGVYTIELAVSCGADFGRDTVRISATSCTGPDALQISPVSVPPLTPGKIQLLQGFGGVGSYGWAVTTNQSGAVLSSLSGRSVTYTAGSASGTDVVTMTDPLCGSRTLSIVVSATANTAPRPEALDIQVTPNPTQGASAIFVQALFDVDNLDAAEVCVDSEFVLPPGQCRGMTVLDNHLGATASIPVMSPTSTGLAYGRHFLTVRGHNSAGWGWLKSPASHFDVGLRVAILLLNGYNFCATGPHPEEWWEPMRSQNATPIACQVRDYFFGASQCDASGPGTHCPPGAAGDAVCVVDNLDGRGDVDCNVHYLEEYIYGASPVANQAHCELDGSSRQPPLGPRAWLADNNVQLILIGHSYGGQIARKFAATHPHKVAGVLTLDTPHRGAGVLGWVNDHLFISLKAAITQLLGKCSLTSDTSYDKAKQYFVTSNALELSNSLRDPIDIYAIASQGRGRDLPAIDLRDPDFGAAQFKVGAKHIPNGTDDVVPFDSQMGVCPAGEQCNFSHLVASGITIGNPGQYGVLHLSIIEDAGAWAVIFDEAKKVLDKLGATGPTQLTGRTRTSKVETQASTPVPVVPTALPGLYAREALVETSGSFGDANSQAVVPFNLETASELLVSISSENANPVAFLTSPSQEILTSASADGLTSLYSSTRDSLGTHQIFVVRNPAAGAWTLNLAVSTTGGIHVPATGSAWKVTVAARSSLALRIKTDRDKYLSGESVDVQATLEISGAPVIVAGVSVDVISDAGAVVDSGTLFDDGQHGDGEADDGFYGGSFLAGAPGVYTISATASGSSSPGLFDREAETAFSVSASSATISGPFVEAAPDANGNGRYDSLAWSFTLHAPAAGRYTCFGDLLAADGAVVTTGTTMVVADAGGDFPVTLSFSGLEIYRQAKLGPYVISNLRVMVGTPDGERLSGRFTDSVLSGGPYWSWMSFERDANPTLNWISPVVEKVVTGNGVELQWNVFDGNGATTLDIYYDTAGGSFSGTPIITDLPATQGTMSYTWDMTGLPDGLYFVYTRVRNGEFSDAIYGGSIRKLRDSDEDGTPDAWETAHGLNPNSAADAYLDPDSDGLANLDEYLNNTDPHVVDTDGGGESDLSEAVNGRDGTSAGDDVTNLTLMSVSPGQGDSRGGEQVLALGSGFQNGATVSFGGAAALAVTFINSTRLMVTTPAHALGTVDVTVTNPGSSGSASKTGAFTFLCEFVEPPVAFSNAGSSPLCPGQDLQLGATGLSGATFSWTGPNGFTSSLQNPTISQAGTAASGLYTVTMQVGSCSLQATTTATVSGPPAPTATNSGPVCAGQDVQLNASSAVNGTFQWTGPGGFTSSSQAPVLPAAQPSASGTYSVTVSVNGCASPPATTSVLVRATCGSFYTVTPCRVLDTRGPAGSYGGPALGGGTTRVFAFDGRCGIPATAKAVSLNVTVVDATTSGHLTLYPGDEPRPLVSAINFPAGQPRANNGIIRLGADGTLAVFSGQATGGTAQVIVDVNGYFE